MAKNVTSDNQHGGITAETVNVETQTNTQVDSGQPSSNLLNKVGAKTWVGLITAIIVLVTAVVKLI